MTKKMFFAISTFIMFVFVAVMMSSCEKHDEVSSKIDPQIEADAIAYYGKVIKLEDFPEEKLLDNDLNKKIDNNLGRSPEKALVPLIFDKNKILYTAKRYNKEAQSSNWEKQIGVFFYYTDIAFFKHITKIKQATSEYAQGLPNNSSEIVYLFDPYVTHFTKESNNYQKKLRSSSLKSSSSPNWTKKGNIIYAKWDDNGISDIFGHTGGIVREPLSSSTNVGYLMRSTKIIEASNHGKSIAGATIGTEDGVFERYMSSNGQNYWNHDLVYERSALWYPGMTENERLKIVQYMKIQIGEEYDLSSLKNQTNKWYCSKLQWYAYKKFLGIDIDSNGGPFVFPNDIKNCDDLVGICF